MSKKQIDLVSQENDYWSKKRKFNLSRTNFWISFIFEFFVVIIPFVLIWVFIGADFKNNNWNSFLSLPTPNGLFLTLILLGLIFIILMLSLISFLLKIQKEDVFTYTFGFIGAGLSLNLNGIWISNISFPLIWINFAIHFALILIISLLFVFIGTLFTNIARNYRYKIEEEDFKILQAYQNGEKIVSRQEIRAKKLIENQKKEKQNELELEKFKQDLNLKYELQLLKENEKNLKLNKRLDEKEKIKRSKHKKNKI